MNLQKQATLSLLLLLLSISAVHSFRPSLGNSTQLKSLPLTRDIFGNHYIRVNFSQKADQENEGKMVVSLYSNETFVARCPNFRVYAENPDLDTSEPRDLKFLYNGMNVRGYPYHMGIKTDGFYAVNFRASFADSCTYDFKGDVHGYIGLGSHDNFLMNTIGSFSVFLSNGKDGLDSNLHFGEQSHLSTLHSKKKGFNSSIQTNKNWGMTMTDIKVDINDTYTADFNLTKKYNVIFDLNTETIGVPVHLYRFIVKILEGFNVSCTESNGATTCHTNNVTFENLPTFGLVMEGNTSRVNVIPLKPELYFDKDNNTLLLKSVSSDGYGAKVVNEAYTDSIVLGASFMQHYYVQFQQDGQQSFVTIQEAEHQSGLDKSDIIAIIIIILVSYILVIALSFVLYRFYFNKEDNKIEDTQEGGNEGEVALKITTPLLTQEEMEVKASKGPVNEERRTAVNSMAE